MQQKILTNQKIAEVLHALADMLELDHENPFRVRAYRKAARMLAVYPHSIHEFVNQNKDLTTLKHIGPAIAAKIKEVIQKNGKLIAFSKKKIPPFKSEYTKNKYRPLRISAVMKYLEMMENKLNTFKDVKRFEIAGSYRRKKELIDKVEIVISSPNPKKVFEYILTLPGILNYSTLSEDKFIAHLKLGIPLVIENVEQKLFGAKLLELTGSEEHYKKLNLSFSSAPDEKSIYQHLRMQYIPPELRENKGEIEAARMHKLPKLITLNQIKGDLHSHTTETDGHSTLEDMAKAAISKGYEYLAITDHTQSLKITNGLDEKRLRKQLELIDALNSKLKNFTILKSSEVDILAKGELDLPNSILKELDLTVCSVHSRFKLSGTEQTDRIIRAMDNPYFNILGHATGRLINLRVPYQINMEQILLAAKERNCFIELNAQPTRLDIHDIYCRLAKSLGVKIAISSDAHSTGELNFMNFGVNQARRGWIEAKDVINTYSLAQLKKILKRK